MSSRPLLVLMALTTIWILPGSAVAVQTGESIPDLISRDEIQKAETLLSQQPDSAEKNALQGEIEYRKGDFDRAAALYKAALGSDSRNARAHFGQGKLALAKLHTKDAIRLFRQAIELRPNEPQYRLYLSEAYGVDKNMADQRKELAAYIALNPKDEDRLTEAKAGLEMLDAFKGIDLGKVDAPPAPAPIRFRKSLNLIFADVMVNGQGPFNFAIDTGASQTVFSEVLATKLGLKAVTTTIIHGVGGLGKVESKIYKADEIKIGDLKITNLPVGTFDDPLVSALADGIIGTSMLSDFRLTINYPESRLELSKSTKSDNAKALGEEIPAWYFNNLLLVPLKVNEDKRGNFILDTGAVTTVLSQSMAARLGVDENTPGAKLAMPLGGVGGMQSTILQVPDVALATPTNAENFERLIAIDLKSISKMIETEISGVIGFDFLESYKVTIDYNNPTVWLSK